MKSALIAGSGGQGILFLGKLLASGAMLAGKNVTWFPSYGAEMRGGTANCTVIVSEEIIGSPIMGNPDILVVMNEASKKKFERRVASGGVIIMDSSLVDSSVGRDDVRVVSVPASEIAASIGSAKSANMVMLGALLSGEGIVDEEHVLTALQKMTPPARIHTLEKNREAILKGMEHSGRKKG